MEALKKWTERNPIPAEREPTEKPPDREEPPFQRDRSFQAQQKDERVRACVYCEKPDHKSVDCKTVVSVDERKRVLSNKHLCFNCAGTRHKAADCKCRVLCQVRQKRHHTSICDRLGEQLMTATSAGKTAVIHPVVVVKVLGVKCREVRIETMLGAVTKQVEIFQVQVSLASGDFSLTTEATKVDKNQLLSLENLRYERCLTKYANLKGIEMEDKDSKDTLPVHLILGASDYAKIKTETAPCVGALGEPIGEKTKLGWTIMSPWKEVDLSSMFFTQTSHVDYDNFCKLNVMDLADSSTGDQAEVYAEFKEQLTPDAEGWYETGLPWRGNHPPLPSNEVGSL